METERRVLAPLGVELRSRQCKSEEKIIDLVQGAALDMLSVEPPPLSYLRVVMKEDRMAKD